MGKADLHIHTTASDGLSRPAEVVAKARENGLDIISVTDHDTYKGFFEAREAGDELGVTVLPGAEITSDYLGRETHLLAYCFDVASPELKSMLRRHKLARINRARWIIGKLRKQGLELDIDEVVAEAGRGNVGRPHIAEVLVRKGYVGNHREAFMRYLSDQMLGKIKSNYASYKEVIETVARAGGASVLAHPGLTYTDEDLQRFLNAGIDGIEYLHPSHNYELQQHYQQFAEDHNLLATGGSDFHGSINQNYPNFGIIAISKTRVDSLVRMTAQRKKLSSSHQ